MTSQKALGFLAGNLRVHSAALPVILTASVDWLQIRPGSRKKKQKWLAPRHIRESTRRKLDRRCEEMHYHEMQDVDRDSLLCLLVSTESHFIGLCTAQEMVNKFRIRKVPLILTKYIRLNNSQVSHTGSAASGLVSEALGQKKKAPLRRPRWQKRKKGLTAYQEDLSFCG